MPLYCPLFPSAEADGTRTCLRCGASCPALPEKTPAPLLLQHQTSVKQAFPPARRLSHTQKTAKFFPALQSSWKVLTLAAGVLLALIGTALLFTPLNPYSLTVSRSAEAPLTKVIASASAFSAAVSEQPVFHRRPVRSVPLAVTLVSSENSHHARVGMPLVFTAFTTPARGHIADLAISFQRGSGPSKFFSYAQGSLCSATWTPLVPGQYTFTAAAQDDRRQTALSRKMKITVDAVPSHAALMTPTRTSPPQTARLIRPRRHLSPVLPLSAASPSPKALPAKALPAPAQFHVVAARFPRSGNAAILANALQANGVHAEVRPIASRKGNVSYVVETGVYEDKAEAQKQSLALQRSGYPAYYFGKP